MSQTAALLQADPRAVTLARQLRAQQVAASRLGFSIPPDYIDDAARAVVRVFGIGDLRDLVPRWRLVQVERETEQSSGMWDDALAYDNPSRPWSEVVAEDGTVFSVGGDLFETPALPLVQFTTSSDGELVYAVKWVDPPGVAVIFAVRRRTPGNAFQLVGQALRDLAPIIGAAVSLGGLGSVLNAAIFSPATIAAYPQATSAFSNLVMRTALSGGDVASAAKSAASGLVGAEFGNVVGTGLDSAEIGQVAAAAATAAVQGGDVQSSVLRSLANLGAQRVDDFINADFPAGDYTMPYTDFDPVLGETGQAGDWLRLEDIGIDPAGDTTIDETGGGGGDDLIYADADGNLYTSTGEFVELDSEVLIDSIWMDDQGNVRAPSNEVLIPADQALNSTAEEMASEIQRLMNRNAGQVSVSQPAPSSRPAAIPPAAAQTRWPTVTDTVKALDAIGRLSAQLTSTARALQGGTYRPPGPTSSTGTPRGMPVGVPTRLPDGRVVTNNGNGTQTVRNADGSTFTTSTSYAGLTGSSRSLVPGVSNQALLIGGAVLIGAVLLARRR